MKATKGPWQYGSEHFENKLAPMPWKVDVEPPLNSDEFSNVHVSTSTGYTIAKVFNPDAKFTELGELPIAHLIAAAPDMLAALEMIYNKLCPTELVDFERLTGVDVETLLAKARGAE